MNQLSLFSADNVPPDIADLGGLLAAHGQVTVAAGGARLSILLFEPWRAAALAAECAARDIAARGVPAEEIGNAEAGAATLLRTDRTGALAPLAADWTRGAVKAVPTTFRADAGLLRMWLIAAGKSTGIGYALGLDPHAPDTHQKLAAALARAGLAGAIINASSDTPIIRFAGRKRLARLREMVGEPPAGAPASAWPVHDR